MNAGERRNILIGRRETALYRDKDKNEITEYDGNPFIEALPSLPEDPEKLIRLLRYAPIISKEDQLAGPRARRHMLGRLKKWIYPTEEYLEFVETFLALICAGYEVRNPFDPIAMRRRYLAGGQEIYDMPPLVLSSRTNMLTVAGISGCGKSTLTEQTLLLFPQIIEHHEYHGRLFECLQLAWLKFDCPPDGSPRALCQEFVVALDSVLGTKHRKDFTSRTTKNEYISAMRQLAATYYLGALVLDEVANLGAGRGESLETVLNFLLTFTNAIGVPLIFNTVPAGVELLGKTLHNGERAFEDLISVNPFTAGSKTWRSFLTEAMCFQYLPDAQPFLYENTNKIGTYEYDLSCALHRASRGIPRIFEHLYAACQREAMQRQPQCITPTLVSEVYDMKFKPLHTILEHYDRGELDDYERQMSCAKGFFDNSRRAAAPKMTLTVKNGDPKHVKSSPVVFVDTEIPVPKGTIPVKPKTDLREAGKVLSPYEWFKANDHLFEMRSVL